MSRRLAPDDEPAPHERDCPACGRPGCRARYRVSHGAILECQACGGALTHYDQADDYERANLRWFGDPKLLVNRSYALPFSRSEARRRLRRLERHLESGQVLELGSGDGAFAHACAQRGFRVIACDRFLAPMPENRAAGVRPLRADATRLPLRGKVDALAAFHLVGHLKDPARVFGELREHVRLGGIVYLETPNYGSIWRRLLGRHWPHFYAVYASHYTIRGLELLLRRSGFCPREIWTHESAVDLLGGLYYAARNHIWSTVKSLAGGGDAPGGPAREGAGVSSAKRALYWLEGRLVLRVACLPGVPIAWLSSRLGVASFVSAIAERRDP